MRLINQTARYFLLSALLLAGIVSCSKQSPATCPETGYSATEINQDGHELLGLYKVRIDLESRSVDIAPVREAETHFDLPHQVSQGAVLRGLSEDTGDGCGIGYKLQLTADATSVTCIFRQSAQYGSFRYLVTDIEMRLGFPDRRDNKIPRCQCNPHFV